MKRYLIHNEGDVEPIQYGPFSNDRSRDAKARELHEENPDDGFFKLNVIDGTPDIQVYSGGFFEDDDAGYNGENNYYYTHVSEPDYKSLLEDILNDVETDGCDGMGTVSISVLNEARAALGWELLDDGFDIE